MRRIMLVVTVALVMAAMMAVMAGTASAQATFIPVACLPGAPESEREELGTLLLVPGEGPRGDPFICTGRPFIPS